MKYLVKNLTRRPVSILCNSGQSYHLPPKHEYELASIEVENNALIKKLQSRQIVELKPVAAGKSVAESSPSEKTAKNEKNELAGKEKAAKRIA